MRLYHTGHEEIKNPDVHYGRGNADFGQGFYLSDSEEFSHRWANEVRDADTIVNDYELDLDGLNVVRFSRDEKWFAYIFNNRMGKADYFADVDVIIGPIANDTIYDTYGIITSGLIKDDEALRLLRIGGEYTQVALKTDKAAEHLHWRSASVITHDEIASYRELVRREEEEFQKLFAAELEKLPSFADIEDIF